MQLVVILGAPVSVRIDGHSAINGATIPASSTVALASNDTGIATVPTTVDVPADTKSIGPIAVTVLAAGSTDITVDVTTPDGSLFHDSATLVVNPAGEPGLVSVSLTLTQE